MRKSGRRCAGRRFGADRADRRDRRPEAGQESRPKKVASQQGRDPQEANSWWSGDIHPPRFGAQSEPRGHRDGPSASTDDHGANLYSYICNTKVISGSTRRRAGGRVTGIMLATEGARFFRRRVTRGETRTLGGLVFDRINHPEIRRGACSWRRRDYLGIHTRTLSRLPRNVKSARC